MLRRSFLGTAPWAALAPAAAGTAPGAGIRLGFDSYSLNSWKWKDIQFLDYAAALKLDTVQLSSLGDFESLEPAHLERVRQYAARVGVEIEAGVGSICPSAQSYPKQQGDAVEFLRKALRVARAVGSKTLRCYMGTRADRRGSLPLEAHMANTVKVLRAVRSEALDLGIRIGIENHAGDMQAREVRSIIEEAGRDFVGSCLDTGNPLWVVEDPFVTLEVLHPYVVTTHVRDTAVFEHPRGAAVQWVALGDGSIDLVRFIERCRALCPHAAVQLEIITGFKPTVLPYFEPDFWQVYPKTPASEFARFVALVRGGRPFLGSMLMVEGARSAAVQQAFREQQKADLERSLEYAKKTLGAGVRWRS